MQFKEKTMHMKTTTNTFINNIMNVNAINLLDDEDA